MQDVDASAAEFRHETKGPKGTPWGIYEFAMSDSDETLVRVRWPSHLRNSAQTQRCDGGYKMDRCMFGDRKAACLEAMREWRASSVDL
jgi:hypothetical protein